MADEAHEVKTFRFSPPGSGPIPFEYLPGQFVTLHIAPWGIPTKRSYTIASSPTWRDRIEITVKREGQGLVSRWLHDELGIGDELEIESAEWDLHLQRHRGGPRRTDRRRRGDYAHDERGALSRRDELAGQDAPDPQLPVAAQLRFERNWPILQARNANLDVTVTMSGPRDEPWSGRIGRIDAALLASTVPDLAAHRVHVCGPPPMMDAVKAALVSLGVPHAQIKTEAFGTVKRDPAAKDAGSTEIAGRAFFLASGVTAPVPVDATILDAADTAGVPIDNACRSGTWRILSRQAGLGPGDDGRRGGADPIQTGPRVTSWLARPRSRAMLKSTPEEGRSWVSGYSPLRSLAQPSDFGSYPTSRKPCARSRKHPNPAPGTG